MSRSKWKGPFFKEIIYSNKKAVATRSSEILPNFIGLTFFVYNGRSYKSLDINKDMIGHKFGEFHNTRVKCTPKKKKQKKNTKKK